MGGGSVRSESEEKMIRGFSSVTIREATCASCDNYIQTPSGELQCRIFTLENQRYGVPKLEAITPHHARYCEYFQALDRDKPENTADNGITFTDQAEGTCDIEETATVRRNLTYPETEKAQEDVRKILMTYLEEGFRIARIELRKVGKISKPGKRQQKNEEITIVVRQ
jgi:hypothetical protein